MLRAAHNTYRAVSGDGDSSMTTRVVDVVARVVDVERVIAHVDGGVRMMNLKSRC